MNLDHRSKLALAVVAALVVPSALAWGVQAILPGGAADKASTTSAQPRSSQPRSTPTPSPSPVSTSAAPTQVPSSTPTPTPSAQVQGPAAPAQQAQRLPTSVAAEPPTRVRLPNGRTVSVRPTRTLPDLSLRIPDDLRRAAWWRGGARLGDLYGSMLVAGHVDSAERGLGPFVELLTIRKGAQVVVTSEHLRQVYRVSARRVIGREQLRKATWVSSFTGAHRLTMVTCAPPYVKARGGYQNLAVVVATPVGPPVRQ